MPTQALTVTTTVPAPPAKAWYYYTEAEHVINWNFASPDWHCPKAINDLRVGGEFTITMAAKDGSMTYDMEGTYDKLDEPKHLAYTLNDERRVAVGFAEKDGGTELTLRFDPEGNNSPEQQREGWGNILQNFRKYVAGQEG